MLKRREEGPLPGEELTPREAYLKVIHGHCEDAVYEDVTLQKQSQGDATSLEDRTAPWLVGARLHGAPEKGPRR